MQINLETGDVHFLLTKEGLPLFTLDDIAEIFEFGIDFASFTLEQPEPPSTSLHPFQHMRYFPSNLSGTNYLRTMAAADVLLKQFTTGVEINVDFPFSMRLTMAENGLLEHLPPKLREMLRPLHTRENSRVHFTEKAHRFWIDVESVDIEYESVEGKPVDIFKVGAAKASVKQFPLATDINGRKIDDEEKKAKDGDDLTAEAQFAIDMTANYEEIGQYFPELLRLEQLIKISFVYRLIRAQINGIDEKVNSTTSIATKVSKQLEGIRAQISQYPINTPTAVEKHMDEARRNFRATRDLSRYALDESGTEAHIISQLRDAETDLQNQLQKLFCEHYALHRKDVSLGCIDSWLRGRNTEHLNKILIDGDKAKMQRLKASILNSVGCPFRMEDSVIDPNKVWADEDGNCTWLPAAFCNPASESGNGAQGRSHVTIYGGVKLTPAGREAVVPISQSRIPSGWLGSGVANSRGVLHGAPKVLRTLAQESKPSGWLFSLFGGNTSCLVLKL